MFEALTRLGLTFTTVEHPPTHTVAESKLIKTDIPGAHSKNLFMKDKPGSLVLVSAAHDTHLPLNRLHRRIGTQRLSFTGADLLWEALAVTPGSVSAFGLLHDADRRVRFVLDAALMASGVVNFHPLRNDMTTSIATGDFLRFAESTGHTPEVVDFSELYGPDGR